MDDKELEELASKYLSAGFSHVLAALGIYRNTENIEGINICRKVMYHLTSRENLSKYEDDITLKVAKEIADADAEKFRKQTLESLACIFEQVRQQKAG